MLDLSELPMREFVRVDARSKCAIRKLAPSRATAENRHAGADEGNQDAALRCFVQARRDRGNGKDSVTHGETIETYEVSGRSGQAKNRTTWTAPCDCRVLFMAAQKNVDW